MAEKTPVGEMPRMVPDRDDIRLRSSTPHVERKPAPKPPEKKTAGSSWAMVLLLIVAGAAIVYLALQQYSLTQLLNSYEERLELADERIVRMEQSLTQTDESVALNGTAINAQFKAIKVETDLQMTEIRKLWDITNKRNRQWIEENQENLAAQSKSVADLEASIKSLRSSQASDEKLFSDLTAQLATQTKSYEQMSAVLEQKTEEMSTVNRAIQNIMNANYDEQFLTLTLTQESLVSEQVRIAQQSNMNAELLSSVQGSIKAVDAGRLETNQRLSALSTRLDTLNARVTALTGTSP